MANHETDDGRPAARGAGRRVAGMAAALVLAIIASAIALLPVREDTLLVGRPGDSRRVAGVSLPSEHLGEHGRWTRGDALLWFPRVALPSTVTLRVAPPDERVPDSIEVIVDNRFTHRATLAEGRNLLSVPVGRVVGAATPRSDEGRAAAEWTLRLRSLTTGAVGTTAGRGVFIDRAVLQTGGFERLLLTPLRTWLGLACGFLGLIAFGVWAARSSECPSPIEGGERERQPVSDSGDAAPVPTRGGASAIGATAAWREWTVATALLGLACAGAVTFRLAVITHLTGAVVACWAGALAVWLASRRPGAVLAGWTTGRVAIAFLLVSLLLIGLLLPDVFLRGHVLSQADMMWDFHPWRAHGPAGYQPFDRPPLGDVPMMVYPFAVLTQARFWAGAVPLWTSNIASGQPFLGTFQSALLSPFTWLLAVVPLPQATVVIAVARLTTAGLGMFLFLRAIGVSRWASVFGGVAYLLNPFTVVWLEHPLAGVPPWLPWMLLAGERLAAASRVRAANAATLAVTTALVLGGGHPHTGMFTAALGGSYAVLRAWWPCQRWRTCLAATGALGLGTALVAVQVLPFLEYLQLSRALALRTGYELNPFFAPASTLITTLVPNFLGHHGSGNFAGPTNYLEQQTYPGVAVWLLAAVGITGGLRQWRTWFFGASALLAFLAIYAAPGVHQLVSATPIIKGASLTRLPGVALACLAVLAALGLDRVIGQEEPGPGGAPTLPVRSRWRASLAITAAAATLAIAVVLTLRERAGFLEEKALWEFAWRWSAFALWLAAAAVVLTLARVHRHIGRSPAAVGLAGVLVLDLLLFGRGFHDTLPPGQVFPVGPEIALAQQDRDVFRVMGMEQALLPNAAMAYGLQDVRSYDGLGVARYADLLDVVLRSDGFLHTATSITSPLIDLLNVKYVFSTPTRHPPDGWFTKVTDGEAPLYRNNRVFPRAFLVDGYLVLDGNDARRTLRDGLVDFRRVVLLEQDPSATERPTAASSGDQVGAATLVGYGDHRVDIMTDAPGGRMLVLTDVHYPGWRASVDGTPAPLYRANFAFRAVPVPPGRHRVVFEYRSASVRVGLAVSGAAALAVGLMLVGGRRPRRDRR